MGVGTYPCLGHRGQVRVGFLEKGMLTLKGSRGISHLKPRVCQNLAKDVLGTQIFGAGQT